MGAKLLSVVVTLYLLSGCAISATENVTKIALLAPFEGQYREIGYEALYATRLALNDGNLGNVDLLAIDDGGSVETAVLRAEAISQDPAIEAVLLLGIHATSAEAQIELGTIPTIIVGHWETSPVQPSVFMLSNPMIDDFTTFNDDLSTLASQDNIIGSELLSLAQIPQLTDTSQIRIYSSSSLADDTFRERYINSAEFVPDPRLIAPLSYDAMSMILTMIISNTSLNDIEYEGITGSISFENGYWVDAPLNQFGYDGDTLYQVDQS